MLPFDRVGILKNDRFRFNGGERSGGSGSRGAQTRKKYTVIVKST